MLTVLFAPLQQFWQCLDGRGRELEHKANPRTEAVVDPQLHEVATWCQAVHHSTLDEVTFTPRGLQDTSFPQTLAGRWQQAGLQAQAMQCVLESPEICQPCSHLPCLAQWRMCT